jgi:hypothetical protein
MQVLSFFHFLFIKTLDSSNSSAESDAENSDFEETEHKNLLAQTKIGQSVDLLPKDPVREAKKYNQRYNLLMERINAINQVHAFAKMK